jgi:putative endonuclease
MRKLGKMSEDPRTGVGRRGEDLAYEFLKKKGYEILERNFRSPLGEIDIIAREGKTLAFIEVKTRLTADFGTAKWAVGPRKQRKLSMVALEYLKRRSTSDQAARFDVVAIDFNQGQERVELFRNAFDLAY